MMDLEWGPVKITGGKHKGKIGYYDDDAPHKGIIYFGDMLMCGWWYEIDYKFLAPITTDDLIKRRDKIWKLIGIGSKNPINEERYELLLEFAYIENQLSERYYYARFKKEKKGKCVFISYSSKESQLARWLSVDLSNYGHDVWLDEWIIKVGDSIPKKINEGLEECDFVLVILSKNSIKSNWVEREWHSKYCDEIESGKIKIIPILMEKCKIPYLLKQKKYADFRNDYNNGLFDILQALK